MGAGFLNLHGLVVLFFVFPVTFGDLNADREALLSFSSSVPHGRKLNWNESTPICGSWVGITCNEDGTGVVCLRLPAVGLYGPIPLNTVGKLSVLSVLSLRSNHLSGHLPSDLTSLSTLSHVYLQHNNLSGALPNFISPSLRFLDLSFNYFNGTLERFSAGNVKRLNLSYNDLTGVIPLSLQRFPPSTFVGNSVRPRPPTSRPPVKKKKKEEKEKLGVGVIIGIAAGGSVVFLVLVGGTVVWWLRRRNEGGRGEIVSSKSKSKSGGKSKEEFGSGVQEGEKNKLVFFGGCSYNFDLDDLLRASAEVLGKGSYGTVYKAILEEGTTVVVKRLKEVAVGRKEFEQQMEMVGRIPDHPHVVPLRAYYYSKDEKLLVYDYISKGSLSASLHGNEEGSELDWESRLKISLTVARGLSHIHSFGTDRSPSMHGNIKSSNVLLSDDVTGRVSDHGLTPLTNPSASTPSRGPGYRAPEVIETRKLTHKSDVYSFGVMLLEMLTGKVPVQSPRRDDAVTDLPRWVQSVVREEWTAEVFDVDLMRYPNIEEELVHLLQIALACVAKLPDARPTMHDVVRMIQDIRPPSSGGTASAARTPQ